MGEALELEGMARAARVVIDAQGWASGVYVVRVVVSDGERTLRVVK